MDQWPASDFDPFKILDVVVVTYLSVGSIVGLVIALVIWLTCGR